MLNRRQVLGSLLGLGAVGCGLDLARRWSDPPNVLLIIGDDLAPHLGCYGEVGVQTPNIDALASESVLFEQARAPVALCTPSRCCFLSGLRPDTTGVYTLTERKGPPPPQVLTLPRFLHDQGYRTLSLGKVFHQGFAHDPRAWSEEPWDPGNHMYDYLDPASLRVPERSKKGSKGDRVRGPTGESPDVPDESYGDGKILLRAIEELKRPQPRPFFMAVGFHRPHMPYSVPRRYWDLYDPDAFVLPEHRSPPRGVPSVAVPSQRMTAYTDMPQDGSRTDESLRRLLHGYRASISYMDALLGRLMDTLHSRKFADDTMVILLGDHGMHLGANGLWSKLSNYDVALHAPLVVRMPGGAHGGRRVKPLVELVDIFPTIAEVTGLRPPENLEGDSLVPLMASDQAPWKSAVFWQYLRRGVMSRSIRTERWRYTRYTRQKDGKNMGRELYDHASDPFEEHNLARRKAQPPILAELDARLDLGWQGARPAPGPS